MAIIKKEGGEHLVYEHLELGQLVAIAKSDQSVIKKFWKKYKGKQDIPNNTVRGFPFMQDEEQESLKINFTSEETYEIKSLKKFD